MNDIFPFPTHVPVPANADRAAWVKIFKIIRPWVACSQPSHYICDSVRYARTGRMGVTTDAMAESLCAWIDALLNHDSGPGGFAAFASGGEYRHWEWRDANAEKLQRTRVAWIDWMIKELSDG